MMRRYWRYKKAKWRCPKRNYSQRDLANWHWEKKSNSLGTSREGKARTRVGKEVGEAKINCAWYLGVIAWRNVCFRNVWWYTGWDCGQTWWSTPHGVVECLYQKCLAVHEIESVDRLDTNTTWCGGMSVWEMFGSTQGRDCGQTWWSAPYGMVVCLYQKCLVVNKIEIEDRHDDQSHKQYPQCFF